MKGIIILLTTIALLGCNSAEKKFYSELDKLKDENMGKEITINRKKFNETAEPISPIYLYTNANRDNIAGEVRFFDSARYELSYGQIMSHEYSNNSITKNIMLHVTSSDDNFAYQSGWISLEYIEEFKALGSNIK